MYEYIAVEDLCTCTDYRAKYNFLQFLKKTGFPFPAALLSYSHGNNVSGLHFVWKVTCADESCFTDSQKVIDAIKPTLQQYHTRFMRKEMFQSFGCLTSSLKPAALRHIYRAFTGMIISCCHGDST